MSLYDILVCLMLLVLMTLSALFSGSEIAFAISNKSRLSKAAESGKKSAQIALYIDKNYTRSISTILIGNDLVDIAIPSVITVLFIGYLGNENGPIAAAAVSTVVVLIFGEILPKILANEYADKLVYYVSYPIRFFMFLFAPVVSVVTLIVNKLEKHWTPKEQEPATTDELVTMLETIEDEGMITEKESELIKSAIEFPDVTAKDILTPRVDVAAFDIGEGIEHIFDDEELLSYSRFPVYRESLDNIIGIMPTKILIKTAIADPNADLLSLLTPPVYVHMTRTISSILLEFRHTHSHMAVVVDEFGGMMGILTLEDILEELFGEIYDESDEVKTEPVQDGAGSYEIDGGMNIYDMFDIIGFDVRDFESEYTTVGGWTTEMLDRFPVAGDSFDYENLTVTVLEAKAMRVVRVRVDVHEKEEDGDRKEDYEEPECD